MGDGEIRDVAARRMVVRALLVTLVGGAGGYLLGRYGPAAASESGGATAARTAPALPLATALARDLVELHPPESDAAGLTAWLTFETQTGLAFARHGVVLDASGANATSGATTVKMVKAASDHFEQPVELAALLDLWAEVAHHANRRAVRDALTQAARALDPEPQRDAIRAALLANGVSEVRQLAADVSSTPLPARSGALLGLSLWRMGELEDAIEVWRGSVLEAPDDGALHLLLAWRLAALDPPAIDETRRHLEAARALLPESERIREELALLVE